MFFNTTAFFLSNVFNRVGNDLNVTIVDVGIDIRDIAKADFLKNEVQLFISCTICAIAPWVVALALALDLHFLTQR